MSECEVEEVGGSEKKIKIGGVREEKITPPWYTMIFARNIDDFANIREEKNGKISTQFITCAAHPSSVRSIAPHNDIC